MKFLILIVIIHVVLPQTLSKSNDVTTNHVTTLKEPIKLDPNLRKALLQALSELENEENAKSSQETKLIQKAPASSISFFGASEDSTTPKTDAKTTPTTNVSTTTKKPTYIVIQRSQGVQKVIATSVPEKNSHIDPVRDAEQILASASNSFASGTNLDSRSLKDASKNTANSLDTTRYITKKLPEPTVSTTPIITTTTEEHEAKVEQLQFFPAPLVVAFTVHQDEQGLPKKVEPIFKTTLKKTSTTTELPNNSFNNNNSTSKIPSNNDNLLQAKQQALENEIFRLKLQQQQQELLLRQQQEIFLRQREEIRLRNNAQPFIPIANPFQPVLNEPTKTVLNRLTVSTTTTQATPVASGSTNGDSVSLQPSISFDPLIEASKLPINGQILPVKEAGNFRNQLVQIPVHLRQFNALPLQQGHRFFRQESGTGNFASGVNGNQINPVNNLKNTGGFNTNLNSLNNIQIPTASFNNQNFNNGFSGDFSTKNNGLNEDGFNKNFNNGFSTKNNGLTDDGFNKGFNTKSNGFLENNFNNNGFKTSNNGLFNSNGFDNQRGTIHSIFDGILTNDFNLKDFQNDFNKNLAASTNTNGGTNNNNNNFAIQQSLQPVQPFHESNFVRNQFSNNNLASTQQQFLDNAASVRQNNNFASTQQFPDTAASTRQNNVASNQRFLDNTASIRQNNNVASASTRQFIDNNAPIRLNNNVAPISQFLDNTASIRPNNRPLRSNYFESTLTNNYTPINNQRPSVNNHQLNSLLYRSGAFGGGQQSNEDLNIVSKVLSLNHLGSETRSGFGGFGKK